MSQERPEAHPQLSDAPLLHPQNPSDILFHLSPFLILDPHSISPSSLHSFNPAGNVCPHVCSHPSIPPNPSPSDGCPEDLEQSIAAIEDRHPHSEPEQDANLLPPSDPDVDESQREEYSNASIRHTVPHPRSAREAYLLLEAARADRKILLTRNTLAHQIVHRNTLVLQYNRMVLENTQNDLRAADQFVGHVRFMIRKSGHTATFECAMQEDYAGQAGISSRSRRSERITPYYPIDVDLT